MTFSFILRLPMTAVAYLEISWPTFSILVGGVDF